jgi:hypothetical protein
MAFRISAAYSPLFGLFLNLWSLVEKGISLGLPGTNPGNKGNLGPVTDLQPVLLTSSLISARLKPFLVLILIQITIYYLRSLCRCYSRAL